MRVPVGSVEELRARGRVLAKAGTHGVVVFWDSGRDRAFALDDRCPHMGFPLHRGTVEDGLVTCHWHHARFDLASGGTLDPFADDVRAFPVEVDDGQVFVVVEGPERPDRAGSTGPDDQRDRLRRRLVEGLEQGLTLVVAKSVLGLLEAGVDEREIVRVGVEFGTANRGDGWGAGLTVLGAMANLLPWLDAGERPLALVHGLRFVSRDTRNRAPWFGLTPLGGTGPDLERARGWYRRFIDTRSSDAAERVLVTAIDAGVDPDEVAGMMLAAATDHIFLDGGHTLDFTNKAFEALDHLGWDTAARILPTLVPGTASASRAEESGRWRHPHDLVALVDDTNQRLPALLAEGSAHAGHFAHPEDVRDLAWAMLGEDPNQVVDAIGTAISAGATPEQLGRALALAAALRITRFHTQNDFGDWDVVHHGFTAANALHQCLRRHPSPELVRGVVHGALKVYLDRFLNVPAARLPQGPSGPTERETQGSDRAVGLDGLQACWDEQGGVDRAGAIAYGYLRGGGLPQALVAALGRALLGEDAAFHWYQTVEAAVSQFQAWPEGSEEGALILAGTARFLAAHTPTRRELAHTVRIATRLRRGEDLFEE